MLFYTFNTLCFEQFLCSNQPNESSWHVKDLAMLLIKFCGKFCYFQRLYVLKIGIQLKHEEISSNSELQSIRRQKHNTMQCNLAKFATLAKLSVAFDFVSSFLFLPNFSTCNSVIFVSFGNLY